MAKLKDILDWVDKLLAVSKFDDVSNNGLQIARNGDDVKTVAFAVDASLDSVKRSAEQGADLLIVHHGISWGGGIKRVTDAQYEIVRTAIESNMAVAGYHLPLDANKRVGNNYEIARAIGLQKVESAFSYHGNIIGVVGYKDGFKVGVCSGGAGEFAVEAKSLGCDVFLTGEANWAEQIAAENVSMPMLLLGHYESEVFGVKALMREMPKAFRVKTFFVERGTCDE